MSNLGGPFGAMDMLAGWHELDMNEIERLMLFAEGTSEIQALSCFCYNSLLAGDIMILTEAEAEKSTVSFSVKAAASGAPQGPKGDKLEVPSAEEEAKRAQRSSLFGQWARDCAMMEDTIGFVPTVCVPNENSATADDDPLRPSVLNLSRVRIFHQVDVYNRHFWRFFEVLDTTNFMSERPFPGLREIDDVIVIGNALPDGSGRIRSRVKRVMQGEWALYQLKKALTMKADRERAAPTLVTQAIDTKHDNNSTESAAHPSFDQEDSPDARRVHALVRAKNTCVEQGLESITKVQPTQGTKRKFDQYELDQGRQYVSTHLAEAPSDLLPARQAFLESVCLEWGVPMSMISNGDATGKAKLNETSASPQSAQIWRDGQSERKRRLELNIRELYQHMYGDAHVDEFIRKEVKKAKGSKVKIPIRDMKKRARVRVQIPCNPSFDTLSMLHDKGVLKYSAFCTVVANQLGLSLDSFNTQQSLTEDAMQINGVAPREPAGGAKPPAKKKAKKP